MVINIFFFPPFICSLPLFVLSLTQAYKKGPFYCSGWGRPADVLVMPDGAMLVSDEQNGKREKKGRGHQLTWIQTSFWAFLRHQANWVFSSLIIILILYFIYPLGVIYRVYYSEPVSRWITVSTIAWHSKREKKSFSHFQQNHHNKTLFCLLALL